MGRYETDTHAPRPHGQTPSTDPYYADKRTEEIQAEINATLKLLLSEIEEVAAQDPSTACDPVTFNARRRRVIRRVWATMKECVRYGRDVGPL